MKDDEKKNHKPKSDSKKLRKNIKINKPSTKNSKIAQTEEDRYYSDLVEMTSDWIWSVDKKGKFTFSNSRINDLLGFTPKQVIGKTPIDLMTKDEAKRFKKTFKDYLRFQKSFRMVDNNFLPKAGKIKTLETSCEPIFDSSGKFNGFICISRDITELKKTIDTLKDSKRRFQDLYENAPDMYLSIDTKTSRVIHCNQTTADILGYSKKEIIGRTIFDLYTPESAEYTRLNVFPKFIKTGVIKDEELKVRKKDKNILSVLLNATAVYDNNGKIIYNRSIWHDITERKKADEKLKKSEHRYKVLFEQNLAGVYSSNLEGEILDCNDAFVKMYGYSTKEEILKTPAKELHPNEKGRKYFIERLNEKGSLFNYESVGKKKDGSLIWITENVHLIDGNILQGTIIDITKRKESEKRYLQLSRGVEQSPMMVIITDVKGKIEYVNPKVIEITGYTKDELIGNNPRIFKSEHTPKEIYKKLWETILQGKVWKGELLNKRKYGGFFWENVVIAPIIDNEGNIINFIGIKGDITEKKKMREELIRAKEKAEEMNELKSNFLANMSHELRTPMVGILGFTEILQENIEDKEMREYAELLHDSGSRLLGTLNLILNLTKIEADKLEIEKTSVDVISVIKRVVTLFKSAADKKNLYLNFKNENDKLITETDERLLDQILNNLINNAVKFTNEGEITVTANRIKNNQHIEIIVKDTGIGIHKDKQGLIWEEFRQASEGAARLFEGTGLGLTITNNFVKKLGGEILLESECGKGSTFIVRLPIQGKTESSDTDKSLIFKVKKESENIEGGKDLPLILLVDDDKVTRDVVSHFLRGLYNFDYAINGNIGIEKAASKKYDIILMDINLKSKPNGVEVTRRIRKFKKHINTPIIAVTAYAMVGDREKYLESGFTDYVSKPFTKNDLIDLLKTYTQNNKK